MSLGNRIVASLKNWLSRFSIFQRIAIGNALVIIIGAAVGTLVTRHLARQAADWWLILLLAAGGILVSLLVNFLILGAALHPLRQLRSLAGRLQTGESKKSFHLKNPDPDTVQLALTLEELVAQLEKRNRELAALSERAINAQEEERKEIARSLHDDTGQALSMLIINIDRLSEHLPEAVKPKAVETRELAAKALAELRRIIFGLRPAILDDLGLASAIRWYARSNLEELGVRADVDVPEAPLDLSPAVTTTLFRVAQEGINNIVRHAGASSAWVTLAPGTGWIVLRVEDDGRGFDLVQSAEQGVNLQQLGLLGMQERVALLGGEMQVNSTPGKGTRLEVRIPVSGKMEADGQDSHPAGR